MQKNEYLELESWFEAQGEQVVSNLLNKWREKIENIQDVYYIFARSFFSEEKKSSEFIRNKKSMDILFKRIDKNYSEFVQEAKQELDEKQLKAIMLNFEKINLFERMRLESSPYIPKGIKKLIYSLLDIKNGDKVLQAYSRTGDFLVDFTIKYPDADITGIDIKTDNVFASEIKASILEEDENRLRVCQADYLNMDLSELDYNKFFSMPPVASRSNLLKKNIESKDLVNLYEENGFRTFNDWVSVLKATLNPKFEKAIFILQPGLLFNERDADIRKFLLENNYVEGIITLPSKLFTGTGIATNVLILSRNNQFVKMIDASDLYKKEHLVNILDDCHLKQIVEAYTTESEISTEVSLEQIKEKDYSLVPKRYTSEDLDLENYVYLKELVKIKRGHANLKQADLDERLTDLPTEWKILTAGDIDDDFTIENLKSLKSIDESEDVYCVTDGEIVLARGGNYKSLIIRNSGQNKIMVNGTLYIITCDEEKINPYYLQMYLASDHCLKQIELLNAGTVISFMSIKQLGEIKIPKMTKDIEEDLANKYKIILDKKEVIRLQKKQLAEETNDLISEVL